VATENHVDLRITDVRLSREASGLQICDLVVKVRNAGTDDATGVTLSAQVAQIDANHTGNVFDASDFGGAGQIGAGDEVTFVGRSISNNGAFANYSVEVQHKGAKVASKQSTTPIGCPA
jgi:hypothetical protein